MGPIELNKRRIFLLFAAIFAVTILWTGLPSSERVRSGIDHIPIPIPGVPQGPHLPYGKDPDAAWDYKDDEPEPPRKPAYHAAPASSSATISAPVETPVDDQHPITQLMEKADADFRLYEGGSSQTFRQTIEKYRSKYGRHPPPGFKEWYKFARKRNVVNIDDFEHIMDDLRPFWTMKPADIRSHAAHMWEVDDHGVAGIHIRKHKVVKINGISWRSETFRDMLNKFIKHLPDMDIAMNALDQPRVLVPYEDLQEMLEKEAFSRVMHSEAMDSFTSSQPGLLDLDIKDKAMDNSTRLDGGWFGHAGKQYMDVAAKACPPESPARRNYTVAEANALYKEPTAGIVNNFNLSTDLCTVGPVIMDLHGMLFSASSMTPTHRLVPVFGECKVNVNNDILFPANMYYKHDPRYDYDPTGDVDWREKTDTLIWRGVTSGGAQVEDNWDRMHRQRLVQMSNGTWTSLNHKTYSVLSTSEDSAVKPNHGGNTKADQIIYNAVSNFDTSSFANAHNDIGFVEAWGCIPNCDFYKDVFFMKNQTTLTSQFASRYLIDVDGHSFSGRWHAFLQSKSLGLKATIFREWHDSRLFQWRHFVPLDNRYDDLYAVMMYFIGYDSNKQSAVPAAESTHVSDPSAKRAAVPPHPEIDIDDEGLPLHSTSTYKTAPTHNTHVPSTLPLASDEHVFIPAHPREAQRIARQSREWSSRVLRREDIEVYMFRLMLEYARLCDDNRDRIGYSGDGSEMEAFDHGESAKGYLDGVKWPWSKGGKEDKAKGSGRYADDAAEHGDSEEEEIEGDDEGEIGKDEAAER